MSDSIPLKAAKALYEDVLCHERGGCTTKCLAKDVWFTSSNSGADRRSPSTAMAKYIGRISQYTEEEIFEASDYNEDVEDEVFPVLSAEHPLTVDWSRAARRPDLAWVVLCPDLYPTNAVDSSETESAANTVDPSEDEGGSYQEDMR